MFIRSILEPLRRAMPLDDPRAWYPRDRFGGTISGVDRYISPEEALYCSVVYACATTIANTAAMLPCYMRKELPRGGSVYADTVRRKRPTFRMLNKRRNTEQTRFEHEQTTMLHKVLWGDSYSEIMWNGNGEPIELWHLHPNRMRMERDPQSKKIIYRYRLISGQEKIFKAGQIHHRRNISTNGYTGMPISEAAANAINLCRAIEEYNCRFFEHDASPPGALVTDKLLGTKARDELREAWDKGHKGLKNAHKVAILDGGLKWESFAQTNRDAEMNDTNRRVIEDILRYFHMQAHKVGILDRSTNNNIEQQAREFLQDTMAPHLTDTEQRMEMDFLLIEEDQDQFFIEHDLDYFDRYADFETRSTGISTLIFCGVLSPNEGRERSNMNLNPVPEGDVRLQPLSHGPLGTKPQDAKAATVRELPLRRQQRRALPPPPAEQVDAEEWRDISPTIDNARDVFMPLIQDACTRIMSREGAAVRKSLPKKANAQEAREWLKDFYEDHRKFSEKTLEPVMVACGRALDVDTKSQLAPLVERAARISTEQVLKLYEGRSEVAPDFENLAKTWLEVRSEKLAGEIFQAICNDFN